jgi:hypothetical protein
MISLMVFGARDDNSVAKTTVNLMWNAARPAGRRSKGCWGCGYWRGRSVVTTPTVLAPAKVRAVANAVFIMTSSWYATYS